MKKDLIEAGIEVYVPGREEREFIGKKIFEELEFGIVELSRNGLIQSLSGTAHCYDNARMESSLPH